MRNPPYKESQKPIYAAGVFHEIKHRRNVDKTEG